MSIKELISSYLNKEISAMEAIRMVTGIFNPDAAMDLLVLINQISRHELGDLDTETFKAVYKIK